MEIRSTRNQRAETPNRMFLKEVGMSNSKINVLSGTNIVFPLENDKRHTPGIDLLISTFQSRHTTTKLQWICHNTHFITF